MTLPATGMISLNQVNVELGKAGTTPITMNDSAVRTLARVPSGGYGMASLRGKTNTGRSFVAASTLVWESPQTGFCANSALGLLGSCSPNPMVAPSGHIVWAIFTWELWSYVWISGNTLTPPWGSIRINGSPLVRTGDPWGYDAGANATLHYYNPISIVAGQTYTVTFT